MQLKLWRVAIIGRSFLFNSTTRYHLCRSSCGVSLREVDREGIEINWNDKQKDYYHNVWLRHNCQCPLCVADSSGQKTVETVELVNSRVTKANIEDDVVRLTWLSDNGEHEGLIPLQWLKQNSYSKEALDKKRKGAEPKAAPKGHLPAITYDNVMGCDDGLWKWLWNLNEYGLCVINNVPTISGTVEQVGERIAHVQETMYGKSFDLIVTEEPDNIAYTGEKLSLHQDLYYESPPGLHLLHCLRNDDEVVGGESLLLDTYPVLEEMRTQHPKEFDTLTKIPATFQTIHYKRQSPVHMVSRVPHIVLDDNNEIVKVNWSPTVEGPLSVPAADVQPYYKAYVLLNAMFNSSDRLLQFRLLPGQLMSFNNRRMLSFSTNGGVRHLQGVFINSDEFNSRFHVLNEKFGTGQAKRIFNDYYSHAIKCL